LLEVELNGLRFKNPTILASGIMGSTGEALKRVALSGAGGVVSKSSGIEAREGHSNPTVVEAPQGVINAVGLSNPGVKEMARELRVAREAGVPVVGSVFGFSPLEYAEAAAVIEGSADAIELNLSCPNVQGEGGITGASPRASRRVVEEVKGEVNLPVWAKLTSEAGDIVEIAKACQEGGADALVATNTVKGMSIDIRAHSPLLGNRTGGLSGPCIRPIALRCVYEISKEVGVPVIGCGGVGSGEDALEYIMAGASAVEIGSGILGGISVFRRVAREIEDYLKEKGLELEDIRGVAL